MRRVLLSVLALLGSTGAAAQQITGDIQGRVLGPGGQPLADVHVTVVGPSLQGDRRTLSDARGGFRVLALPPGALTVRLSRIGYRPLVIEHVEVQLGHTTSLGEVTLPAQATELPPLVVTADRPAIDPLTSSVGTDVPATVIAQLPVGRDYRSIMSLLPQANESYFGDGVNVAGGTGLENSYFVDGVNVTEPYRGDGGIDLPLNFIDHLQLKTGGFDAEYGRALGGIVNVVTQSGGEDPRLSVFGFFTGSGLASSPDRGLVDKGNGNYTRYDFGVSLGGPIRRNRLWYLLAYDAAVERQQVQIPGSMVALDHGITHKCAAKLTWRANPRTDLVFMAVGDPSTRDIVGNPFWAPFLPPDSLANPDPFLGVWNEGGVMLAMRGDHLVGQRLHLAAALSRTSSWQENGAATSRGRTEPLYSDDTSHTWSGGYGNRWDRTSTRSAASLSGEIFTGEHSLKGGVQYEDNQLEEDWRWRSNGPDSAGWVERTGSSPYPYFTLPLDFRPSVHNRIISLFVQGSFLATPWLRLNPGLRWDGQFLAGPGGARGSITDQIQPRLGFVAYPSRSGLQKVTGSFGRFYEQLPTLTVSFWWGGLSQDFILYPQDPRADTAGRFPITYETRATDRLQGQHYDEFTLGYERGVGTSVTIRFRGVHRILREILTTVDSFIVDPASTTSLGANPGRNPVAFLPRPKGSYTALELTAQKLGDSRLTYMLSYVLSRHYGNYVGLYDQDASVGNPNAGSNFSNPAELQNAAGLLPNDRTHVFKAFGSYRVRPQFTAGSYVTLQSGTPLSYLGANPIYPFDFVFLRPRGTAGRTPWIWDVNLHLSYDLRPSGAPRAARIVLDAFHLFSGKRPVRVEQKAFLAVDSTGQQTSPNPLYGQVLLRQPPMTLRVGLQLGR